MERRSFLTERSLLGAKPDRKKAISDRKKDVSEGNLMERRFQRERRFFFWEISLTERRQLLTKRTFLREI